MEKYHIYEEIGKGNFSQVFKGREKKKIEYVAIKRIEKSEMPKIVAEVQVMHKLSHPHVLRFYDWYETRHNLWLILEYCTGGDLESILKQDGHLPETSIRIFGVDIVAGMKYLHSLGFIHCDLRPRNFLIDEYGILKISDFKRTVKIPTQALGQKPIAERGIASYMAPELFTSEGVNSFQSDFWALGCVLYELRRGFVPFGDVDERLDKVINNIQEIDPIAAPIIPPSLITPGNSGRQSAPSLASISNPLADLLRGLFEKSILHRCSWEQLSQHPFWAPANPSPPQQLPPQPVFDNLIREMDRVRFESVQKQIYSEMGVFHTDASLLTRDDTTEAKMSSPSKLSGGQGITAASAAGLNNGTPGTKGMRRQWDEDDAPPPPSSQAKSAGTAVVPRSTGGDSKATSEPRSNISDAKRRLFDEEPSPRNKTPQPVDNNQLPLPNPEFFTGNNAATGGAANNKAAGRHAKGSVVDTPFNTNAGAKATQAPPPETARQLSTRGGGSGADSYSTDLLWDLAPEAILSHGTDSQVKPIVGNRAIEDTEDPEFGEKNVSFPTYKLDRITQMTQDDIEAHLTQLYKVLYKSATSAQSSVANATVVGALTERVNVLTYLSTIAPSAEVANVVLNTHFLSLLLKLLKTTTNYQATQPLRNQSPSQNAANAASSFAQQSRYLCAHNLAMMLRYATYIQAPTIRTRDDHIVGTLIQVLKDTQGSVSSTRSMSMDARMRRKAAAALGEMIFYISAQDEETPATGGNAAGGDTAVDKWTLAPATVDFLIKSLKDETDEIIKHYLAKTIENVQAQGGFSYRKRFVTYDLCLILLELAQNSHRNESLQSTCAMALYHILYFALRFHQDPLSLTHGRDISSAGKTGSASSSRRPTPSTAAIDPFAPPSMVNAARFLVKVLEKANLAAMIETFQDGTPKLQQAFLNIVLLLFCAPLGSSAGSSISTLDPTVVTAVQEEMEAMSQELQQQSVFATLAMMVTVPEPPISKVDTTQSTTIQSLLNPLRAYFMRAQNVLVPALFRLMDQGGATPLRAKAVLLMQCLCSHVPTIVVSLPERKFSAALVRILEPYLSALEGQYQQQQQQYLTTDPQQAQALLQQQVHVNNAKKLSSPTYLMKAAMSMVVFLRKVWIYQLATLALYVEEMAQTSLLPAGNGTNSGGEDDDVTGGSRRGSLSPTSPNKTKGANGKNTTAVTAAGAATSRLSFSSTQLMQVAKLVRALVALFASPALVRLLLPNTVEGVRWLARVLQALPAARARLVALPRPATDSMLEALDTVEQTALLCLEFVAQVDIPSFYLVCIDAHATATPAAVAATTLLQQKLAQWSVLITMTLQRLVPAASRLLSHPEVDIRIMITGTFRRLLPPYVRAFFATQHPDVHLYDQHHAQELAQHSQLQKRPPPTKSLLATLQCIVQTMLSTFLVSAPSQLTDVAPIPQYALRIYQELLEIHPSLTREWLTTVWKQSNVGPVLMQVLQVQSTSASHAPSSGHGQDTDSVTSQSAAHSSSSAAGGHGSSSSGGLDPLLITVIRQLWDAGQGQETVLLQQDLAGALTVAVIATVYAQISYPFPSADKPRSYELQDDEGDNTEDDDARGGSINYEVVLPLLDLLYTVLHYVLKITAQPTAATNNNAGSSPSSRPGTTGATGATGGGTLDAPQYRRLVTSLRATSPALLLLIAYAEYHLAQGPAGNSHGPSSGSGGSCYPTRPSTASAGAVTATSHSTGSVLHHLLDLSTKSLGMLFDLFPDTVASQLLSRQSVLLDQQQQQSQRPSSSAARLLSNGQFVEPDALSPRLILTSVFYNPQVDLRVVIKILKIFYGASKVAVNMGHVAKVKDWVLQEPVYPALQYASRWSRLAPYLPPASTHADGSSHHHHHGHANATPNAHEAAQSIQRLAAQLLDMVLSLQ